VLDCSAADRGARLECWAALQAGCSPSLLPIRRPEAASSAPSSSPLRAQVTSMRQVCGISKAGGAGVDPSLAQVRRLAALSCRCAACCRAQAWCGPVITDACLCLAPPQEMVETALRVCPPIILALDQYVGAAAAAGAGG
jgi:hypothetical protein